MFKYIILTLNLSVFLFSSLSLYAAPQASQNWLNATANTRNQLNQMQQQIQANAAENAKQNQEARQNVSQSLKTLIEQNNVLIKNSNPEDGSANETPEFKPRPSKAKDTNNNPWLQQYKPEQTQNNPYKGQQYGPQETNRTSDGIYIKQDPNSNKTNTPVNIFK